MEERKTIVLVLRSGGDFAIRDVELIARHIQGKWQSSIKPRIICLWDKASQAYDLGNFEIIPYTPTGTYGTWDRILLYGPRMEEYKPFLYVDLDTAVIQSLETIFNLIKDPTQFITLEDFWQRGSLATGLVWFPKDCEKTKKVWDSWKAPNGRRMDNYIRSVSQADQYWQKLTNSIYDFKPRHGGLLQSVPTDASLICFHGKPRIFEAVNIGWVNTYVNARVSCPERGDRTVTVIIPYNRDRGWLNDAIGSIPEGVQLLLSQGEGNWPENFNKVLDKATGRYIRWLHEDDMLTPNCIEDSIKTFEEQDVDFIHGQAVEIFMNAGRNTQRYTPPIKYPTVEDLLHKNVLHSATMMYKREVFEKVGKMNETLNTAEEFEFNLRCLKAGLKIGYCEAPLAFYRRHPQQKVRVVSKEQKDAEREQVRTMYR